MSLCSSPVRLPGTPDTVSADGECASAGLPGWARPGLLTIWVSFHLHGSSPRDGGRRISVKHDVIDILTRVSHLHLICKLEKKKTFEGFLIFHMNLVNNSQRTISGLVFVLLTSVLMGLMFKYISLTYCMIQK